MFHIILYTNVHDIVHVIFHHFLFISLAARGGLWLLLAVHDGPWLLLTVPWVLLAAPGCS